MERISEQDNSEGIKIHAPILGKNTDYYLTTKAIKSSQFLSKDI